MSLFLLCSLATAAGSGGRHRKFEAWRSEDLPVVDPLNCSALEQQDDCELRNGCSWCKGVGTSWDAATMLWEGNETGCRRWQHCEGPSWLCELRQDYETCENPPHGTWNVLRDDLVSKDKKPPKQGPCRWCATEDRCVLSDGKDGPTPHHGGTDLGQCMGCDGKFDSGVVADLCGVCSGGCMLPDASLDNPACKCLGCDLVPFSGRKVDVCGECGGDNSTCSLFPVTLEEKVGVILALSGNVIISASLNIQKYTHNLNQASSGGAVAYTDIPLWWAGMGLMVLGETGNFLAYAYAPATLVAPLGAVTVVSNCIIAHYVLRERVCKRNMAGVVLAIIGAVFIVIYAPDSQKQLTMDLLEQYMMESSFIVFILGIVLAIVGLFLLDEEYKRKYVIFYVLICSLCGSLTVMCVKGVSTALVLTMNGAGHPFANILPWVLLCVLLVTTVVQIRILNLAMMHFGASEVVPVYYVLFTFCSVVGGMVLYKEYHVHCPAGEEYCNNLILFLFGIVVTFAGVFLITFAKHEDSGRRGSGAGNREYLSREGSAHRDAELADAEREGLLSEAPFDTHSGLQIPPLLPSPRHQHDLAGRGAGPRFLASEL